MSAARPIPGVLFADDRKLIDLWAAHGLPINDATGTVDDSTARYAVELTNRLLGGLDSAWDVIDALTRRATP